MLSDKGKTDMTDAILFSANPKMVDIDDARRHLEDHGKLYWTVGFRVAKDAKAQFSFPILGFIHIAGVKRVEYRAMIVDIVPFAPHHYENPLFKPASFRERWKNNPNQEPRTTSLIMTELVPFSYETSRFEKPEGGPIQWSRRSYVRVAPPNEPRGRESRA